MSTLLRVYADTRFAADALELLRTGIAPHELVLPAQAESSVLAKSAPDPLLSTVDVAFGQPHIGSVLASERLRWVQVSSAGYTRYDTPDFREAATARGLALTNSSTVYAEACAEHVFAFMLAQARRLPLALSTRTPSGTPEWFGIRYTSPMLLGQKAVILGYGAIAARLLEMLAPFKMDVVAFRRRARGDEPVPVVTREGLPAALAEADHVINILPDNAESVGFVSAELLAALKPGAVFYNIGRGTTVDQDALVAALKSGHLDSAWLDVTEPEPLPEGHPLLSLPNCFITPHTAGGHRQEQHTLVRHFLANFQRHLAGEPLLDRLF